MVLRIEFSLGIVLFTCAVYRDVLTMGDAVQIKVINIFSLVCKSSSKLLDLNSVIKPQLVCTVAPDLFDSHSAVVSGLGFLGSNSALMQTDTGPLNFLA